MVEVLSPAEATELRRTTHLISTRDFVRQTYDTPWGTLRDAGHSLSVEYMSDGTGPYLCWDHTMHWELRVLGLRRPRVIGPADCPYSLWCHLGKLGVQAVWRQQWVRGTQWVLRKQAHEWVLLEVLRTGEATVRPY